MKPQNSEPQGLLCGKKTDSTSGLAAVSSSELCFAIAYYY